MKNQKLIQELVDLEIYSVCYDDNEVINDDDMTITDSNNIKRKVNDNNLSENEIMLLLSTQRPSLMKSIKSMLQFFVILTVIGLCFWAYIVFKGAF